MQRAISVQLVWTPANALALPVVIRNAGERISRRLVEFFTANFRNKNTREAYCRAVNAFMAWCDKKHLTLQAINPAVMSVYIELPLQYGPAKPTVKQLLAAIRMLFVWLMTGGVMEMSRPLRCAAPSMSSKKERRGC